VSDRTERTSDGGEPTTRERLFHAAVEREPWDDNVQRFGFDVHPVVFPLSIALVLGFLAVTIGSGGQAATAYTAVFDYVNGSFGWLYVLSVNVFLVALVAFGASGYGTLRLGGPDARPEFSRRAWLAMLFSAGMGIGLLFFGVAEPMYHFLSGGGSFFDAAPRSPAAGRAATAITMFHWGVHPWAIYGVVGLGLAFFSYNRGLPLGFRSVLYPLLGDRIHAWPGHVVDLSAVIVTVFGLATAVGLGALQITAGLGFLATEYAGGGFPATIRTTALVIATLIGITTVSVLAGLEAGIKRLSGVNVVLMLTLLGFVFFVGPTVPLLDAFNSGLGAYLGNILELSFYAEAFAGDRAGWQHGWTVFYWGFWVSWAPFVGLFIARISKGRTVREFVAGVLFAPVAFSVLWMAVFNGAAIFVELNGPGGTITGPLQTQGQEVALFALLSHYPFTALTGTVATANLVTFVVTSADSGALVTSYLTAGGRQDTPRRQRAIWPLLIGATAVALLFGNGLDALRTAVVTAGLPFAVLILVMVYTLYVGLRREADIHRSAAYRAAVERSARTESDTPAPDPPDSPTPDPSDTPAPDPSDTPAPDPSDTPTPDPPDSPALDPSGSEREE
jgi:choline/carnitine/betaine transport